MKINFFLLFPVATSTLNISRDSVGQRESRAESVHALGAESPPCGVSCPRDLGQHLQCRPPDGSSSPLSNTTLPESPRAWSNPICPYAAGKLAAASSCPEGHGPSLLLRTGRPACLVCGAGCGAEPRVVGRELAGVGALAPAVCPYVTGHHSPSCRWWGQAVRQGPSTPPLSRVPCLMPSQEGGGPFLHSTDQCIMHK